MAERLTLYYDDGQAIWLDAADRLVHGSLREAGEAAGGRECVVLLPSETVLLASVELPPIRQSARRLQAARYALEDQLVERVEHLHFALSGRADATGRTAVAVLDLETMQQVFDACTHVGMDVVQIAPDALALPPPAADQWQVALLGERAVVRTQSQRGFACERDMLGVLTAAAEPPPALIHVHAASHEDAAELTDLGLEQMPGIEQELHGSSDGVLAYMLRQTAISVPALNLRQGRFARKSAIQARWQPLKITAGLAAAWLVLAVAGRAAETWKLDHRIQRLDAQSNAAFHDAFPNVQTVNDLRVQAEEGIRALRGSGSSGGVFPLLQATAAVTAQIADMHVQSMQYHDGELDLSIDGKSVQSVEALRAGFARQTGTTLTVQSADASSNGVQIRALVTPAGAAASSS